MRWQASDAALDQRHRQGCHPADATTGGQLPCALVELGLINRDLQVVFFGGFCNPRADEGEGPLPVPKSSLGLSCGPKQLRCGLVAIVTVIEPVPVTGLAANVSPRPRIALPRRPRPRQGGHAAGDPRQRPAALPPLSVRPGWSRWGGTGSG